MTENVTDDRANAVFAALADSTRRTVLESVSAGGSVTATGVAEGMAITRQAVLKHLTVLADAGLVESAKVGREVRFSVLAAPLRETASWLAARADAWDGRLAALKSEAERRARA